jgi:hypothetical protein
VDERGDLGVELVGFGPEQPDALPAVARRARTVARCASDLAGRLRSVAQERIWLGRR